VVTTGLVAGTVAALAFVMPAAGDGKAASVDPTFVFEPTPEAPDAQAQGAAAVAHAQNTAKAGQPGDAARELEDVDRRLPASIHDCNLALAYLRAASLTRAQLAWDLSGLRNGARPTWCTGEVSTQLSQALRASKYVPVALDVSPPDALVEVLGIKLRNMGTVWLAPGPQIITASAPGKVTQTVSVTVAAPTTRVAITLEAPAPAPIDPDAGVGPMVAEIDGGVVADATPLPAVDAPMTPVTGGEVREQGAPFAWRAAALTTAIAGIAGAGLFGYLAYDAKQDANDHYASDPRFGKLRDHHSTYRIATIAAGAVGIGAAAFYIYLVRKKPAAVQVGASADGTGIGISYGGTFGGGQ
jgi:hypothetical protein